MDVTDTKAGGAEDRVAPAPARSSIPLVSTPASTGGAGTTFEQHVGAYWLAQLLVRGIPPILIDATVSEVSFQTERLGWQTDDMLVVCERTGAAARKLAVQVKRSFTVSASDNECVKAIGDFWNDFNNIDRFYRQHDHLALITLRGTNTLLKDFTGLLECARASSDSADFAKRVATPGFISNRAVRYCGELQQVIAELEGRDVSRADLWPFLCALHVLSLDLHSSTRQMEAHIKSLLALSVTQGDPVTTAAAAWNELVAEASTAMVEGRTIRRDDLPASLLARHGAIDTNEQRVLRALADHTAPVLRAIRSTIGPNLHLPRAALVQKVLDAMETAQVVIVAGPAGSGKSAIAKDAANILARNHFLFGFRVEEFAQPHLDVTLNAAQVPASSAALAAILAAKDRKVVLIESVERLLEKTSRDAFADLMAFARDDATLRILLTCRDYSLDLVRTSFLQSQGSEHALITVPPLDDDELGEIEAVYPALAIPLGSQALRKILRNPFVLDKALGIPWAAGNPLPQTEREFRAVFWHQFVRADHRVAPSMARRREEAIEAIAVRRARALSTHVLATDVDPAVIESLRADSLIISSEENPSLVATAHDVIEDWAILQWLEEQHLAAAPFSALSDAIGTHPAVRRSYRKWVAELVERDGGAADRLFRAAISETDISMQFRDDTIVSLLKSTMAPEFLARHEAELVANERAILKRVIHLLRVACVKTPDWLARIGPHGSVLNVPDGAAWVAVLQLAYRTLAAFVPNERPLLVNVIENAVRGVSWWAPDVEGARYIAGIAHWLLDGMRGYGGDDVRKRVLKVIAKIPKADPVRFEAVLRGHIEEGERRDPAAEDLQELIYAGVEGMAASRDLPDLIIAAGAEYLLAAEADLASLRYIGSPLDLELYFGIKEGLRHDSFPASGLRGPWRQLLRFHPAKALDFYAKVFNHSADWYAHPRLRDRLEPAWEVELTFADGTTTKQWANGRLWGLYRGMTVGPYVLQSMLMALEDWLLDVAKNHTAQLDSILGKILRGSDSGALAAVVASVATAHPHACGEALLALLAVPDYIALDRSRMVGEQQVSAMAGMLPTFGGDHEIYETERKQANALPHRGRDLEAAITTLQLGPFAPRVHALLDRHLAALPPKDQQQEHDLRWRLSIHRMDIRQYTVSEVPASAAANTDASAESAQRVVQFVPKQPDAEVQAIVDEGAQRFAAMNARLGILVWGLAAFQREAEKYDSAQWEAKLTEARAIDREVDYQDGSGHGPGHVAAVCVRDHWDEMTDEQRDWCVSVVCSEVLRHADNWNQTARVQRYSMAADRSCAFVLASLLCRPLSDDQRQRTRKAFAAAITHPVDEVRTYLTWGIDDTVWASDRPLALRCVNAIATEAALIEEAWKVERSRPYHERADLDDIIPTIVEEIRRRFWEDGAFADDAYATVNVSRGFGAAALARMLVIFERLPQDPLTVEVYLRASDTLVAAWKAGEDHKNHRERNYHTEGDILRLLEEFLLRTSPENAQRVLAPMLGAIDRHSRELHGIMQGLTGIQDRNPNTPQYWFLWSLFAEATKCARWVGRLGTDRHPDGSDLLGAVFLTSFWKDDVRHWRCLEGYAHLVHALFEALPSSSIVLDDYVRFLYHIGERSLPEAFVRIASAVQRGDPPKMLSKSNTVLMLEVLLQRYVYGRPLELKRARDLRDAVLFLLDCLVEAGSSAAFRMRDDFVTPAA